MRKPAFTKAFTVGKFRSLVRFLPIKRTAAGPPVTGAPYDEMIVNLLEAGMSAEQIAQGLYRQDLAAGGWTADMGLWQSLYIRDKVKVINGLAAQRYGQTASPAIVDRFDCP